MTTRSTSGTGSRAAAKTPAEAGEKTPPSTHPIPSSDADERARKALDEHRSEVPVPGQTKAADGSTYEQQGAVNDFAKPGPSDEKTVLTQNADHMARLGFAQQERAKSLSAQQFGLGSGNSVEVLKDGKLVDAKLADLVDDDDGSKMVTLSENVYEERPIMGSERTATHLLFPKGARVPLARLKLHEQAAKAKSQSRRHEVKDPAGVEVKEHGSGKVETS